MRYYSIVITDPDTGQTLVPDPVTRIFKKVASGGNVATYTSLAPGATVTTVSGTQQGALRVDIDIPTFPFATPQGGSHVRIWGISLAEIGPQSQLNGMNVKISGGMAKGLPLAKPQQAGVLAVGKIYQAFGNWSGVDMTLDLIINPDAGTQDVPKNISFNWKSGQLLSLALAVTLGVAFPNAKQMINISSNLVLSNDEPGFYWTLTGFAQYVKNLSQSIIGGNYPGVEIVFKQDQIYVFDGTTQNTPLQLAFEDMVGQPTWIDAATVNVALVMRSDLYVGQFIKFPTALTAPYVLTSTPAAAPNAPSRNKSAFQGNFLVTVVHHFGSSRQPDAASWVTMINAVVLPADEGTVTIEELPGQTVGGIPVGQ